MGRMPALVVASGLVLSLAACGGGATTAESSSAAASAPAAATSAAAVPASSAPAVSSAPASAAALNMLFIPYNTGNPYFDRLGSGMKEEAASRGAEYSTDGPATAGPTAQIPFIEDGLAKGVNVIGIYANDPKAMASQLSDARSNGAAVLSLGADIDPSSRDAAILATDNDQVGPLLVDLIAEQMGNKGQLAILSGTPESPDHNYWIDGIKKYLKDPKFAGIELVEVAYGNDVPEQALSQANGLLTKYPDLKGIIGVTTVAVSQAAQAVSTAGKSGQVYVTGLGLPKQMSPYVTDGTVKDFALWDPADMGRVAACLGADIVDKSVTAAPGATFTCGTLGERTIRPDGSVIAGDLIVFNKDNVAQYDF